MNDNQKPYQPDLRNVAANGRAFTLALAALSAHQGIAKLAFAYVMLIGAAYIVEQLRPLRARELGLQLIVGASVGLTLALVVGLWWKP